MRIFILTPESQVAYSGNQYTAERWAELLSGMAQKVVVATRYEGQEGDLIISLHAEKSHEGLMSFRAANPGVPCIVALTGTDLYPALSPTSLESLEVADHIIVLQRKAIDSIPLKFRSKASVVIQSVMKAVPNTAAEIGSGSFDVCVVGHLGEVKDPLLTARASRALPDSSSIRIRHAGGILEEKYRDMVAAEEAENPRYHWLGELDSVEVATLIAESHLIVLTSLTEGGAAVIGEAIVAGTPVLSTATDGAVGLLGEKYPGLFPVGDHAALAVLLRRCEGDPPFYQSLKDAAVSLSPQFAPKREIASLSEAFRKGDAAWLALNRSRSGTSRFPISTNRSEPVDSGNIGLCSNSAKTEVQEKITDHFV